MAKPWKEAASCFCCTAMISCRSMGSNKRGLETMIVSSISARKRAALRSTWAAVTFLRRKAKRRYTGMVRKKNHPNCLVPMAKPQKTAANRNCLPRWRSSLFKQYKVKAANRKLRLSGCHHRLFLNTTGMQSKKRASAENYPNRIKNEHRNTRPAKGGSKIYSRFS